LRDPAMLQQAIRDVLSAALRFHAEFRIEACASGAVQRPFRPPRTEAGPSPGPAMTVE
jgi:hypothetical protein